MSNSNTDSELREFNDFLVGRLIHQNIKSIDALIAAAHDYPGGFERTWAMMEIIAKVWDDRADLHGYVTEHERRLILRTDKDRGSNAIVLLIELRGIWRKRDTFALSARSPKRPIMPELGRDAFSGAVAALLKSGCIVKVRNSRFDIGGHHEAALYQLCPVREQGEQPEVAKKPRASKSHTTQERTSEPPRATEETSAPQTAAPELPSTSPPEAEHTAATATFNAAVKEKEAERETVRATLDVCKGLSKEAIAIVLELNTIRRQSRQPMVTRAEVLDWVEESRRAEAA